MLLSREKSWVLCNWSITQKEFMKAKKRRIWWPITRARFGDFKSFVFTLISKLQILEFHFWISTMTTELTSRWRTILSLYLPFLTHTHIFNHPNCLLIDTPYYFYPRSINVFVLNPPQFNFPPKIPHLWKNCLVKRYFLL